MGGQEEEIENDLWNNLKDHALMDHFVGQPTLDTKLKSIPTYVKS